MGVDKARILVLVKGLGIGGAERLIASAAEHWDRNRFAYHVAYVLPWKDQLVPLLRAQDVPVTCIGSRRGLDPSAAVALRRLVQSEGTDLIHAHLPATGVLARVVGGRPVVYTEHNIAQSYRRPMREMNRATYRLNRAVIAVSDAVAASLEGFPGPEPEIIDNGVAVAGVARTRPDIRAELGVAPHEHLVVHVGNIRPHKGHSNLIAATRILGDLRTDVKVVSVGGEKHPGDLDRVREEAGDLGDRIRFLGRKDDALSYIAAADVFANPADVEGLPVAILEALALERPVVATAVGGVPGAIDDQVSGLLVPPGDPSSLAKAIHDLLDDPQRRLQMGKAGRRAVESRFGLERMVRRYEAVYTRVLDGRWH